MEFGQYLASLRDPALPLSVSELPKLSALTGDQAAALQESWPLIDPERRARIIGHTTQLAEDSAEYDFTALLVTGLSDDYEDIRRRSIQGLWDIDSGALEERLVELMLHDSSAAVRAEAALALGGPILSAAYGRLPDRRVERIESALRSVIESPGEIEEVRARALEAIGPLEREWVRQEIEGAYTGGSFRLKVSALHAMGRSCEERWVPMLTEELASDEAEIRFEAATALGEIGDENSIENLVRLVLDEDDDVRAAATTALGEIGGDRARQALLILLDSESEATREAAAAALSRIDIEGDPLGVRFHG
jgi:HEAT repeat protein